jgi:hypothetical protein
VGDYPDSDVTPPVEVFSAVPPISMSPMSRAQCGGLEPQSSVKQLTSTVPTVLMPAPLPSKMFGRFRNSRADET